MFFHGPWRNIIAAFFALHFIGPNLARGTELNTLTEAEKAQGWMLMFDGKSSAGWHSYRQTTITSGGWVINDSALYRRDPVAGSILAPEKFTYTNFEVSIDWKVADNGNSGIFLRYLEDTLSENIRTGPECQVCGKLHPDYGDGLTIHSAGACYDMYPPAKTWIKSADQYNTFHVVVFGKRLAHFGNGIRLLEYEIGTDDWTKRYLKSKYSNFPRYGEVHAGKIFLQDHGNPVWYRNIKIRPLTTDPWSDPTFVWPDQVPNAVLTPLRGNPNLRIRLQSPLSQSQFQGVLFSLPDDVMRRIDGRRLSPADAILKATQSF